MRVAFRKKKADPSENTALDGPYIKNSDTLKQSFSAGSHSFKIRMENCYVVRILLKPMVGIRYKGIIKTEIFCKNSTLSLKYVHIIVTK